MIGLDEVFDLVRTSIYSGQVQGERPLSLILVAPPGAGKTSVIELFECETAHFFSDFTSREVVSVLKKSPLITHILIGDFLSVFGHNKSTVKLSTNLIARLTGDEVKQMPWSGEDIKPRRMGVITAIPPDDIKKREVRNHVHAGGFASRFLIANYVYSQATIDKVHKYIKEGRYRKEKRKIIDIKAGSFQIGIGKPIAEKINRLALQIKRDPIGFRAHFHMRSLIMSIARADGRNTVLEKDYEKLCSFAEFFTERGKII